MGIHGKFFEEPRERSQHTINGQFMLLMADVFTKPVVAVYDRIFATRDAVTLVPVTEAYVESFNRECDNLLDRFDDLLDALEEAKDEDEDYPPEAPIGWDSA